MCFSQKFISLNLFVPLVPPEAHNVPGVASVDGDLLAWGGGSGGQVDRLATGQVNRWSGGQVITCLDVPERAGHVAVAGHDLRVVQEPTAGEVSKEWGVFRWLQIDFFHIIIIIFL